MVISTMEMHKGEEGTREHDGWWVPGCWWLGGKWGSTLEEKLPFE